MFIPTTTSEKLLFSTIKIDIQMKSGVEGSGTGFIFHFLFDESKTLPLIITNRHVVQDAIKGKFYLHETYESEGKYFPSDAFFPITFDNFESYWIGHPNNDIDLCAMPFRPIRDKSLQIGKNVFTAALDNNLIWSEEQLSGLSAVEDIVMVGYPIGLSDEKNYLPIFRRGSTATHPSIDFNGHKEFLIDAATFPGSSGSPVLLLNESGTYYDKNHNTNRLGHRVIFLGVLYAGPEMTAEGQLVARDIPTARQVLAQTPVMINLGYVIKASEVLVLSQHVLITLMDKGLI